MDEYDDMRTEELDGLEGMEDDEDEAAAEGAEGASAGEESSNEGSESDQAEETERSPSEMSTDELVARYRELEGDAQKDLLDELEIEKAKEVLSAANDTTVAAPATDEPVDWAARWRDGVLAEMTGDLDVFAAKAVADMKGGRLPITSELREAFDEALAVADSLPPQHSHRKAALERAAGIAEYARREYDASIPFGLGGIQQSKTFQKPDGSWHLRETDGRNQVRETPIERGQAPSELYEEDAPPQPIDPKDVKTLEDAARLTVDQWMELGQRDPERKEMLLRLASEKQEELHRAARAGGTL